MRITGGAKRIMFSSFHRNNYYYFILGDVFQAVLPSTSQEEFNKHVSLFQYAANEVDEVVRVSGYGRVYPLVQFEDYTDRVERALEVFDVRNLSTYVFSESTLPESQNSAILLDASSPVDLDEDEQDLKTIYDNYEVYNATWNFSSDYIFERVCNKLCGTDADVMVESMYHWRLGRSYNKIGPAICRLFERCAVKPGFISRHGLECRSVDATRRGEREMFTVGKGCTVHEFPSNKLFPLEDVVRDCTDATVLYSFANNYEGFDCFIPPNNFVGFTDVKSTGHPISLSFALKCCELIEGPVNFITAVPASQATDWGMQSFHINVPEAVQDFNDKSKTTIPKSSQRNLDQLPSSFQTKLKPFRQFVGSLVIKRTLCFSVRPTNTAAALFKPSILLKKLFK
jgi:hypothetical protein